MREHSLSPAIGSKRGRKRVGRGDGSGHGSFSCRGCKGQKARAGGGVSPRFEGGQTPLVKRLPFRRGFTNIFKIEYEIVNVRSLAIFDEGAEVTPQALHDVGLVASLSKPVKILGGGELSRPLVVKAHKFSQSARTKIEASGGRADQIQG